MEMLTNLHHKWHRFWAYFHHTLIHDCIDKDEQKKLQQKVAYHQYQMQKLR
ncbi:hypothetical protein [Ammoniphilus sp. CFH 90114]|uniref:hypothetical protein n=1 Tax=Ammoniphilus sp. CFH 90114 TaxID=2493665 RepID=UPI0013E97F05|nr:hypothetical protein [Ammoniphilus sp. CFH 90114]